jgi:hypothetical protein
MSTIRATSARTLAAASGLPSTRAVASTTRWMAGAPVTSATATERAAETTYHGAAVAAATASAVSRNSVAACARRARIAPSTTASMRRP